MTIPINQIMIRITFILLNLAFLSGCVGPVKYLPPTEGPIANIIIEPIDDRRLVAFTYDEAEFCTARKIIKRTYSAGGTPIVIKGNQDISISLGWDIGSTFDGLGTTYEGCNPTVTFKPTDGLTYIVSPNKKDFKLCELEVFVVNSESKSKIYAQPKRYRAGLHEGSSFCEPLF